MTSSKRKRTNWVSASDAGRAEYCPHYLELEEKGANPSKRAVNARIKGEIGHDRLNELSEDKRCFIASHLYGIDDNRTQLLRDFRDSHLLNHIAGRMVISIYYRLSPLLVTWARCSISINYCLGYITDTILQILIWRNKDV